jgi:hypothetical protein
MKKFLVVGWNFTDTSTISVNIKTNHREQIKTVNYKNRTLVRKADCIGNRPLIAIEWPMHRHLLLLQESNQPQKCSRFVSFGLHQTHPLEQQKTPLIFMRGAWGIRRSNYQPIYRLFTRLDLRN